MSTETSSKFQGRQADRRLLKGAGTKEDSGFTHNHNIEPVTFEPDKAHLNDAPGKLAATYIAYCLKIYIYFNIVTFMICEHKKYELMPLRFGHFIV